MSASISIHEIEHISNCDIITALADPTVRMNDHQYNGDRLFEYCLAHGGFRKFDPDKESDSVCLWGGNYFYPWPVTYEGKTYGAYLLCRDIQTDEGWEEIPVALVLLDESVLEIAQPPVHNVISKDDRKKDPDLPTDPQLEELGREHRHWGFAHTEQLKTGLIETCLQVLTDGYRCLFCTTIDSDRYSDSEGQVCAVYSSLGELLHGDEPVCLYNKGLCNDLKLLELLDKKPTCPTDPDYSPVNWRFQI